MVIREVTDFMIRMLIDISDYHVLLFILFKILIKVGSTIIFHRYLVGHYAACNFMLFQYLKNIVPPFPDLVGICS